MAVHAVDPTDDKEPTGQLAHVKDAATEENVFAAHWLQTEAPVFEYAPAERGTPTKFEVVLKVPSELSDEQIERLSVIAAKCPVHRMLDGEVMFDERVERTALAS